MLQLRQGLCHHKVSAGLQLLLGPVDKEVPCKDGLNPNYNDYRDVRELKDRLGVKLVGSGQEDLFSSVGVFANFWTASLAPLGAWYHYFDTGASMGSNYTRKDLYTFSVRLVKD